MATGCTLTVYCQNIGMDALSSCQDIGGQAFSMYTGLQRLSGQNASL